MPVRRSSPVGRQAEPLQLPQTIGGGRVDPFEARPMSAEAAPTVDQLMHHYLTNLAYRSFPFYASKPLIELWWPFVRSDEVLFNVVLLLSGHDRIQLQQDHTIHMREMMDQCLTMLVYKIQSPVSVIRPWWRLRPSPVWSTTEVTCGL
ncbi:hypothetical protein LTR09_004991 [Extremus antarcticus]|uniref:Uncharacterized protein n=1 Tax=Extremus antarcticus TaxID=702011 RepID=A0AAJ0DPJ5_9PEZI|nr:hypothetical protein LTR09_004991 [Extremus antarcticus]